MKPKLQLKLQNVGDARTLEHLLINDTGNKWSQLKRGYVGCKWQAYGGRLPMPVRAHIKTTHAPDAGHGVTGFNVCSSGFWSCFGPLPPFYTSISPFWHENVYSVSLYVGHITFFLIL
jgi:hypothetical protein